MEELQIYNIVNDVTSQALGTKDLSVVNEQGLVSLGQTVLNSGTHTDDWVNTLVKRIGKTIISHRAYRNQFTGLMKDSMEWGAIVQKLKLQLVKAEPDQSYGLEDGTSVDHYKIANPKVVQKIFITETPYQFSITIQRVHLKEAFMSAGAMGAFISAVYGEVQNSIEVAIEELGRTCLANYMAEVKGTDREIKLVTSYNTAKGAALTPGDKACLFDDEFLRYAIGEIKKVSKKMKTMAQGVYNDGTTSRHSPLEMQKMYVLTDFETALETQVEYAAFNDRYLKLDGFEEVAYWQSIKDAAHIKVNKVSDGTEVDADNIMACVFDRESLGMYNQESWTATTPMNAAGGYFNTYWHEKQLWFNDLSENFVVFTLN